MIELCNISLGYDNRLLLRNAEARFAASTLTALVGRNGTGKSTLIRAIIGSEKPLSGEISICGTPLTDLSAAELAQRLAYVGTERIRTANLTCRDVVAMGRMPYTNWFGTLRNADFEIVDRALEAVEMQQFAHRDIATLSDGEAQRIMIAKALAQESRIILLDEPSAFLDIPTRFEVARLLMHLAHDEGKCILFSTHDTDAAFEVCDQFAAIESQQLTLIAKEEAHEKIAKLFGIAAK